MKVLGLDTSAVLASVAVVENGKLVVERTQVPGGPPQAGDALRAANHSAALLELLAEALREEQLRFADLGAVGIAIGPGSFTGLRVGLSTAKGLVYGSDIPLFGVHTLEAMARRVPCRERAAFVCPVMDARKGQVYAALYRRDADRFTAVMGDTLDSLRNVLERVSALASDDCIFLGQATRVYGDLIDRTMGGRAKLTGGEDYPSTAAAVARIAEERSKAERGEALETLAPHYLRPPDAVPPKPRV